MYDPAHDRQVILVGDVEPTTTDTAERPAGPQRLGEFRVHGVLGEGAYGTVYAAEREAAPGADAPVLIALKVLRAEILPRNGSAGSFSPRRRSSPA
jgi:hypothetical protein